MRTRNVLLLTAVPALLLAARPVNEILTLQPESRVWVSGGSTVRDYKCTTNAIESTIVATAPAASVGLTQLVRSAQIEIPLAQLDCGNGTMNGHMRKALKSEQFPKLRYALTSYAIAGDEITMQGTLTIAGKELPIELKGSVTEEGGMVRATATQNIRMTEWGVKPPTLMLGTMKVHDEVAIGFDIAVKR